MKDLSKIREEIDVLDDIIVENYIKRMELSGQVASIKKESQKPVLDSNREQNILFRITENVPHKYQSYVRELYKTIFTSSKLIQSSQMQLPSKTRENIQKICENGLGDIPIRSSVACQGVNGANSSTAATKIFSISNITFFKNFEGVFNAVSSGLCDYGVLPIENSRAGSVLEVYDLMKKHNFHIVKSVRLKIEHCLCGVKGTSLKSIKKVISHPQALSQCKEYIEKNKFESEIAENTAVSAKKISELNDKTVACLCSLDCAEMYGLSVIDRGVQDNDNNYTRFICIGKKLEVFKGSNKISIMTSLSHKPGSLNTMLTKFSTLGLNLTKIESRPIVGTDFEFMFYFDFEGDITSPAVLGLIAELENSSDKFTLLGCYGESI